MRHSTLRATSVVALITVFALPCQAQQQAEQSDTLISLSVAPAAAPKPALKYMLLPELKEINPGNPIHNYLKVALEEYHFLFDKVEFDRREKLLTMPLKALPTTELRDYGHSALARLDKAARLDNPDWQILLKLKSDGLGTLLPDVQQMRSLARALNVRLRSEIAISNFAAAIKSAQTMFAMARHMDEHPTLIGDLVGIAIAGQAIDSINEMLEQPGCPNLYWALTNLPDPLVGCKQGRAGERLVISMVFNDLKADRPMTSAELKKYIDPLDALFDGGEEAKSGKLIRAFLDARAKDPAKVAAAHGRLIESGIPEKLVKAFPVDQTLLLDEKRECDVRFDDATKIMVFPAWQFEALLESAKPYHEPALFADALLPGQYNVRRIQARLEQRFALLRAVEALRMYAAEHNGTFPAKLSDCPVPLPDDPFTGKPFGYEPSGKTAHLRGTPPKAEAKNASYRLHYELTLRD
jgi:hypothetical protein